MVNVGNSAGDGKYLQYFTEQVSNDLNDCRLKIVSSHDNRARWYRQRTLNASNEIVDNLIDSKIGKVVWHSIRPASGWYLYISSPKMPKEAAIAMTPAKSSVYGSTPLSFSMNTSIDAQYLASLDRIMNHSKFNEQSLQAKSVDSSVEDVNFTAVHLDGSKGDVMKNDISQSTRLKSSSHARTSSRVLSQGHARLRSTGRLLSNSSSRQASDSSQAVKALDTVDQKEMSNKSNERNLGHATKVFQEPYTCHFLLTEYLEEDGQVEDKKMAKGWLKWAWDTATIRMPLELISCKCFSLIWLNPNQISSGASSNPVEILRYENDLSWSNWLRERRGKIVMQHDAIKALKVDIAFWMAVALAYLEYVEERDGYHAAMDG